MSSDSGIAVVRRNTEEVQSGGNFEVFEELFASDFVDHTLHRAASPRIATALESCTAHFVPHFPISPPRSTGKFQMVIV
jgi:hypothetical protein